MEGASLVGSGLFVVYLVKEHICMNSIIGPSSAEVNLTQGLQSAAPVTHWRQLCLKSFFWWSSVFSELLEKASILGQNFLMRIFTVSDFNLEKKQKGKMKAVYIKLIFALGDCYLLDSAKDEYLF